MPPTLNEFTHLTAYVPVDGAVTLAGIDSVNSVMANLLTGLSFASQQALKVDIGETLENIIALPFDSIDIEDESIRQSFLLQDLLKKLKRKDLPEESIGLVVTGLVSNDILNNIRRSLKPEFSEVLYRPRLMNSLHSLDQLSAEKDITHWLWVSVHAGCALRKIHSQGRQVATNLSSECPMPADAAVAVLLTKQNQGRSNRRVLSATEFNAEDPYEAPTDALAELFAGLPEAQNSEIIHNIANSAAGNMELYRLEQSLNEKRPEPPDVQPEIAWLSQPLRRLNMTAVLGDLGVCSLPLQLLLQRQWQQEKPLITLAVEGQERFVWLTNRTFNKGTA